MSYLAYLPPTASYPISNFLAQAVLQQQRVANGYQAQVSSQWFTQLGLFSQQTNPSSASRPASATHGSQQQAPIGYPASSTAQIPMFQLGPYGYTYAPNGFAIPAAMSAPQISTQLYPPVPAPTQQIPTNNSMPEKGTVDTPIVIEEDAADKQVVKEQVEAKAKVGMWKAPTWATPLLIGKRRERSDGKTNATESPAKKAKVDDTPKSTPKGKSKNSKVQDKRPTPTITRKVKDDEVKSIPPPTCAIDRSAAAVDPPVDMLDGLHQISSDAADEDSVPVIEPTIAHEANIENPAVLDSSSDQLGEVDIGHDEEEQKQEMEDEEGEDWLTPHLQEAEDEEEEDWLTPQMQEVEDEEEDWLTPQMQEAEVEQEVPESEGKEEEDRDEISIREENTNDGDLEHTINPEPEQPVSTISVPNFTYDSDYDSDDFDESDTDLDSDSD